MRIMAEEADGGVRADTFLARTAALSRSQAARLLADGHVLLNGRPVKKNHLVSPGECFFFENPDPLPANTAAEKIELDVVYEDDDLIVVNKRRGMVVHPAPGHGSGTLVNALLHHCGGTLSGIGGILRPGIVHRLDKDTSGLLLAAKHDRAHTSLSAALKERRVGRVYEAVVQGHPRPDIFTVCAPIGRHPAHRKKMAAVTGGRPAVTHVETLAEYRGYSHVRCKLETGRTHQIRVHLAHTGHPLLGDALYGAGPNAFGLTGQCLHARFLTFPHPRDGRDVCLSTELPEYFEKILTRLAEEGSG